MNEFRPPGRYGGDVLSGDWRRAGRVRSVDLTVELDQVLEDPTSGFCGAVVGWDRDSVQLEDRDGRRKSFPFGPGFWLDGTPVTLRPPARTPSAASSRTASGSIAVPHTRARIAQASRIYVEGRHDAELVEKVWGADLRLEGIAVEYLDGVDDLPDVVAAFDPAPTRRLGVLVDHLVEGSKESRLADAVRSGAGGEHVLVVGHPYVDVWQAVRPQRLGLGAWPTIPRGTSWKAGVCAALGWPNSAASDLAAAWRRILGSVRDYRDLEPALLGRVEELIDFVTT